jgi:hypothetical protein
MEDTAFLMWVITAVVGALLLLVWLRHGGVGVAADDAPYDALAAQGPTRRSTRFAHSVVTLHVGLAVVGLGTWAMFAPNRNDPEYESALWLSLGILVTVAFLGLVMYRRWLLDRRAVRAGRLQPRPAEQHMPALLVWAHGLAAVATIALVVAVALDS